MIAVGLLLALALPDRVPVPAGMSTLGSGDGDTDERPARRAFVAAFELDRTEVTVGAYRRCVARGVCAPVSLPADDTLPVTGVSWHEARRFCRLGGGRLPTEAEWERAARGDDGRRFPWGDAPSCEKANHGSWKGEGLCGRENPGRPEPVGRRPAGQSPFGALDLAGNVWEWVADAWSPRPARGARNPRGPARGARQVVKGGSCCSELLEPRAANRAAFPASYRDEDIGFRCAYSPGGPTGWASSGARGRGTPRRRGTP